MKGMQLCVFRHSMSAFYQNILNMFTIIVLTNWNQTIFISHTNLANLPIWKNPHLSVLPSPPSSKERKLALWALVGSHHWLPKIIILCLIYLQFFCLINNSGWEHGCILMCWNKLKHRFKSHHIIKIIAQNVGWWLNSTSF